MVMPKPGMVMDTFYEVKNMYQQARIKISGVGAQGIIMVGLDGWNFSKYDNRSGDRIGRTSRGKNVRVSANSPMALTINEWRALNTQVEKAYKDLLDKSEDL